MKRDIKIEYLFVAILVLIGFYYMYLASKTQMLGEDEDTYFSLSKDFSNGLYKQFDYPGIPKPLPVFVPLISSFFFLIFGPSLAVMKSVVALFALLTLLVVYLIGRKISIYFGFFSAVILLSITLFSHSSMLAYVEVPIAFFSALLTYLLLNLDKKSHFILKSIVIGITLGLAYYTKLSGLLLLFVLFLCCSVLFLYKKDKDYIKLFLISLIGFAFIVSPFIIRNLIIYKYPFFEGLNFFFKPYQSTGPGANAKWVPEAAKLLSPASISLGMYIETFGLVGLVFSIFGISWFLSNFKVDLKESYLLFLLLLPTILFLLIFNLANVTNILGSIITEPRYLSIIFPQIALLGGFFLWKTKEENKYFLIALVPILLFALYSGVTVAQGTSTSQRYPDNYIEALKWLKTNTPEDSIVFTAYGGSVDYFAERKVLWVIDEFPDVMHTSNSTYIYNALKSYNISYILIWRGIVAQDYIVPQSNLIGAFTYNFINVVSNDQGNFDAVFQNQDNIIFKLK
jgi:4-amino-4-deoxy-L-arabinose transferase-like glycosyltransferase